MKLLHTLRSAFVTTATGAALVALTLAPCTAHADAPPPIGQWVGAFADGSTVELYVQSDGSCMYGPTGAQPTVGTCSWNTSSPVGGILNMRYQNVFESHAYYSVVWTGGNSFVMSDPYFRVVMRRRG